MSTVPTDLQTIANFLVSAFDDTRFPSISLSELHTLSTSITLLTDFEAAANALDWEVGMHGIRISFQDRGKRFGATYLPNVAVEQVRLHPLH